MELRVFYKIHELLSRLWPKDVQILASWDIRRIIDYAIKTLSFARIFNSHEEYSNISKETKILFLYTSYCELLNKKLTKKNKKIYIHSLYENDSIDKDTPSSIHKDYNCLFENYDCYQDFIDRNEELYREKFSWDFIDMKLMYLVYNDYIVDVEWLRVFLEQDYGTIDMDSFQKIINKYIECKNRIKYKK